jgi:DNA-binding NarL/FixJ family response regulator
MDSAVRQAIFAMKARGETLSEISRRLDVSRKTVRRLINPTLSEYTARSAYCASLRKQIARIERALEK